MDVRELYDQGKRDPEAFPLFDRIWNVLAMSPSSKHQDEEELVQLAFDAFDYLQADGAWRTLTANGSTELLYDGNTLRVKEEDDRRDFAYEHTFTIR